MRERLGEADVVALHVQVLTTARSNISLTQAASLVCLGRTVEATLLGAASYSFCVHVRTCSAQLPPLDTLDPLLGPSCEAWHTLPPACGPAPLETLGPVGP